MLIRRRGLLTVVLSIALILVIGRAWGALVGDHAWFSAQGFADIWWWRTTVSLLLKFAAGTVATLVMRAHLEAIRRSFVSVVVPGNLGNLEFTGAVPDRTISLVLWGLAVLVGLLLTIPITDWVPFAAVLDARPLGEADPYFQYDLAFWTSWFPFELQMYTWALVAHASISLLVIVGYVLTRGIGTDGRLLRVSRHARRHVTVLGAILLVLIAWSYRLDGFDRLIFGSGTAGSSASPITASACPAGSSCRSSVSRQLASSVWSAWSRQPRAGIAAVTTVLLMALLLRQGLPLLAESLDGGSDTVARERRYQDARDSFTRRAYESDRVLLARRLTRQPSSRRRCGTAPPCRTARRCAGCRSWHGATTVAADRACWLSNRSEVRGCCRPGGAVHRVSRGRTRWSRPAVCAQGTLPPIIVSDSGRGYAIVSDPMRRLAAPSIAAPSRCASHMRGTSRIPACCSDQSRSLTGARDRTRRSRARCSPRTDAAHRTPCERGRARRLALVGARPVCGQRDLSTQRARAAQRQRGGRRTIRGDGLVNAHTGHLILVDEPNAPLLARRPLARLRRHLDAAVTRPGGFRRHLPPRADAIDLEAAIAAHAGSRSIQNDTSARARAATPLGGLSLVRGVMADSALAPMISSRCGCRRDVTTRSLRRRSTPVARSAACCSRPVAPIGGCAGCRTPPPRPSTPSSGTFRRSRIRFARPGADGAPRSDPCRPGLAPHPLRDPVFRMRDGRPTQLAAVLVTDGVRRDRPDGPDAALSWRDGAGTGAPATAAASLYRQMRDALQRGAWSEFGSRSMRSGGHSASRGIPCPDDDTAAGYLAAGPRRRVPAPRPPSRTAAARAGISVQRHSRCNHPIADWSVCEPT